MVSKKYYGLKNTPEQSSFGFFVGLKEESMRKYAFLGLMILSLILPAYCLAAGIAVGPGEIILENVPLGKKVAVSALAGQNLKLNITNKNGSSYIYTINILYTTETNNPLREGYRDIPDTSWVYAEKKEVEIEGNGTKAVELYLKIPKNKKYAGKKYQAIIEVKNKAKPGDFFNFAAQPIIRFSTAQEKK